MIPEKDFIEAWLRHGGQAAKVAKQLNISERAVYQRRTSIESMRGFLLPSSQNSVTGRPKEFVSKIGQRAQINVSDGTLLAFGDEHCWPGDRSLARDALLWAIKELQPKAIVCDGDAFDGARISRHPPAGWNRMPELADELAYCQEMMGEIEAIAPPKCKLIWCMGNHDSRFSARLSQVAPEYVRINGTDLTDHFPAWNFAWSCFVNDDLVIKHRYKGGVHSAHNNTLGAGRSIATGHDHMLKVTPYHDYNGIRYGVNLGFLSEHGPEAFKFGYAEDNPANWGSGFGVFTFGKGGEMYPPEVVTVLGDKAYFRGRLVATRAKRKAAA